MQTQEMQRNCKILNGKIKRSNVISWLQKIRQRFAVSEPVPPITIRNAKLALLNSVFYKNATNRLV